MGRLLKLMQSMWMLETLLWKMWKFETLLLKILFQVCFLFRYQTNAWEQGQVKTELEKSSKETKDVTLVYNWCPQGWDAPLWHCGHCYTKNHCHCPFSCAKYFHQHLQPKLWHFVLVFWFAKMNPRASPSAWVEGAVPCLGLLSNANVTWMYLHVINQLKLEYIFLLSLNLNVYIPVIASTFLSHLASQMLLWFQKLCLSTTPLQRPLKRNSVDGTVVS